MPSAGHPGIRRTLKMVYRLYTWPRASKMIGQVVRACLACQAQKSRTTQPVGKLHPAPLFFPFFSLSIDLVGPLVRSIKGNRFLLTVCEPFSGYLEAFPIRSSDTRTIARILVNEIFCRYGIPHRIYSDNAQQFLAKVIRNIYSCFRIKPALTTLFHPKSARVERAHRELMRLVRTFIGDNHRTWDENIRPFCLSLNATPNVTTQYSPAYLVFGHELNLPQDPVFAEAHEQSLPLYAANLVSRLRRAIQKAKLNRQSFQQATYEKINRRRVEITYPVGAKVWVKSHFKSSAAGHFMSKLNPRFIGPFVIQEVISPLVYRLKDLRDGKVQKGLQHVENLRRVVEGEEIPPAIS